MTTRKCAHYISTYLPITEVWIYNQIKNLRQFQPIIFSRYIANKELFPIDPIISLRSQGSLSFKLNIIMSKLIGYIPYFKKISKKENIRLIHVHFGYHGIKFIGLKKTLNIPLVCSFYGHDAYRYPTLKKKNLKKLKKLFNNAEAILVLGETMKKHLISLGCPPSKLIIHHLGIETNKISFSERKIPTSKIRFLMTSSFVEKKGIDITLKALAKVKDLFDFEVHIIGDGKLREPIKKLISTLDLDQRITLHGYQNYQTILDFAYKSDVFLQASRTAKDNDKEGTPMVFADMMATGLPIISTKHSDIPEMIEDGINGYLAQENDVDSFANKIVEYYKNRTKVPQMSKNCRLKVEADFCATEQAHKLDKLYTKVIDQ